MRIDAHAHFAPQSYRESLLQYPVGQTVPAWSLGQTEHAMSRYNVEAVVLSAAAGVFFGDRDEAMMLARIVNEAGAAVVGTDPSRFAALACLPLPGVDAALEELAFALDELGLDGVILPSNVDGVYIGEPEFAELLDELDRRSAYVFVHPAVPALPPGYPYPPWLVELPFETTRAAVSLVYSGTLARCPHLRIQLAHMGGAVPFLAHRIASFVERDPQLQARVPLGPLAYLERFFYDTALSMNAPALAATREVVGLDRIVFGTDWPYLPDESLDLGAPFRALSDRQIAQVESTNAAALVPRFAER
jgi:predicted TIM-barrel fold metal-dependent hydrolase